MPVDEALCRRCQTVEPVITVRTEPLCEACFCKYVQTKIVKRMESFRVRNTGPGQERRLLLPIRFDHSAAGLLHALTLHLRGQIEKTGRTGFKLYLLHIQDALSPGNQDDALSRFKNLYSEHEYHALPLSDVLLRKDINELFPANLSEEGLVSSAPEKLQRILTSLKSVTSQADVRALLERKLVVDHAKSHQCEAVIWPDSTTKLAERTLAETAKGRGFSLPWLVGDGESPCGVENYYPLRDLLTKELEAYISFVQPSLEDTLDRPNIKPTVSTKNSTIDDLMTQYFASAEQDYPAIVANVVKTTAKLQAADLHQIESHCELCEMPLTSEEAPEKSRLCYGCIRTMAFAV